MAKTQKELEEIKKECEDLGSKLCELSDDELEQITGGDLDGIMDFLKKIGKGIKNITKPVVPSFSSLPPREETLGGGVGIKGGLIDDNKD